MVNSLPSSIYTFTVTLAFLHLLVIYPCATTSLPPDFPPPHLSSTSSNSRIQSGGLMTEDKMRLGSRPPSCHNKCNLCHPCMAVQSPTMPSQADETSSSGGTGESAVIGELWSFDGGSAGNDRYSNYKPLGWKCRCRNRIYDP